MRRAVVKQLVTLCVGWFGRPWELVALSARANISAGAASQGCSAGRAPAGCSVCAGYLFQILRCRTKTSRRKRPTPTEELVRSRDGRARSASRRGACNELWRASAQRERREACDELWRASAQRERARSASRGAERAATSCGGRARSASCRGACDELRAPRSLRREVNASPSVGHLSGSSAEHPYI